MNVVKMNWVIRVINVEKHTIQMLLLRNIESELMKVSETMLMVISEPVVDQKRPIKLLNDPKHRTSNKILKFNRQVIVEEFNKHLKKRCKG